MIECNQNLQTNRFDNPIKFNQEPYENNRKNNF